MENLQYEVFTQRYGKNIMMPFIIAYHTPLIMKCKKVSFDNKKNGDL